jgi:hypothetical protein
LLEPCWVVRVHVPLGVSRRRPLAAVRAVLAAIRGHGRAGRFGDYHHVIHAWPAHESFSRGGARSGWFSVALTTHLVGGDRDDVLSLARAIDAAHPWEHPVIECFGPDGAFVFRKEVE